MGATKASEFTPQAPSAEPGTFEVLAARELQDSKGDVGVASQEPMKQTGGLAVGCGWAQSF